MKKLTLTISILVIIGLVFSSCNITRPACPKKLFKKYQPRLQGNQKWDYRKHQGPKQKLIK